MQSAVKRELDLMMVTCPEKPRSKYFPTASPIRSLMRARKASPTSMCFPDMRSVIRNCPFYPGLHCREFILVVRPHKLRDSLLAEFTQVPGDRSLPSLSVFPLWPACGRFMHHGTAARLWGRPSSHFTTACQRNVKAAERTNLRKRGWLVRAFPAAAGRKTECSWLHGTWPRCAGLCLRRSPS